MEQEEQAISWSRTMSSVLENANEDNDGSGLGDLEEMGSFIEENVLQFYKSYLVFKLPRKLLEHLRLLSALTKDRWPSSWSSVPDIKNSFQGHRKTSWTNNDSTLLLRLVEEHDIDWNELSEHIFFWIGVRTNAKSIFAH